jgi:negative regulator of flagellin synthesis FlgM
MPPIELGPTRPIGAVDVRVARQAAGSRGQAGRADEPVSTVVLSAAVDPGEAPIDTNRIEVIRRAVESGQYPLVPAKIADALIAAGMLLRKGQ